MSDLPYTPSKVGSVYNMVKATVFGFTAHDNTLIALSVQAPTIQIEQIHFQLQGQDNHIGVSVVAGEKYNRNAYSKKCHFEVVKNPIPDTSEVSMIMLNQALYSPNRELNYAYVWHRDAKSFKNELWHRVRDIIYDAVLEEWADFLYVYGANALFENRPLCGRLPNRNDTKDWNSASFDIGFVRNDREQWQKLISRGLEEKLISIDGAVPIQAMSGTFADRVEGIIYRTDGTSEKISPKNGTNFKLEELTPIVEGRIEIVRLDDGRIIVLNEDGKNEGLDINHAATKLFWKAYGQTDVIVGNVLVCKSEEVK